MHNIKEENKRIDWLYSQYCDTSKYSRDEFIKLINKYYYKHSSVLYKSRDISDIEDQYKKIIGKLGIANIINLNIVNIGAGQGFELNQFINNGVSFRRYYFIEPSKDMIANFKKTFAVDDIKIEFINSLFSKSVANNIRDLDNKVFVVNSCLHHFIEIDSFLELIKSSMNKGDIFILSHEPNNHHASSILRHIGLIVKLFLSRAALYKFGILKNSNYKGSENRWNAINKDLVGLGIINQDLKPLIIRRIIDYGVNTKNDCKKLNIPLHYNEGFWNVETILGFFDKGYSLEYFDTYRHFGDYAGSIALRWLNSIYNKIFSNSKKGSVFSIVVKKI